MMAHLAFFLFVSVGCLTCLGQNMTTLPATKGIILSGGDEALTSVEVFIPSTGQGCSLPELPDERYDHTMDSLLICGGGYDQNNISTTCLYFASGQWIISHTLVEGRTRHSSWETEHGVVLMGGGVSRDTSEIVANIGEQGGLAFAMQFWTITACSMPDLTSESVIITGGDYTMSTVSRYGVLGWVEDLPSLVVGRYYHGCGSFARGDGTQVFLVAGGADVNFKFLSSTEVLTMDSPGWTLTTPLPRAVAGVMGVTVDAMFYITGGYDDDNNVRAEIMGWLDDEQEWEETGKMKIARTTHAVSTIQMDDQAMEYCG